MALGSNMTCFDWHNLSSEYLDGSLAPVLKRKADDHLAQCSDCHERHQHYRLILESLHSLTRIGVPNEVQHELETGVSQSKTTSNSLFPWVSPAAIKAILRSPRTIVPGFLIICGLVILAALPKIRSIYETRLQKRLDSNNFAELSLSQVHAIHSPSTTEVSDEFSGDEDYAGDEMESASQEDSNGEADSASSGVQSPSQLWRFNLRTDSPQEIRSKIQQTLHQSGALPSSRYIHGFLAPGGIQFDALIPADKVKDLQEELASYALAKDAQKTTANKPFTWFRNKSKRVLPPGTARVVIWLSLN
ncbi:MAG: zf-HC2 domain-containing protein [Bdellovibrionales bacterium]|nr:zf-HC2 domain-containing protein [Bdellovibrionales bacterium]